jgi:hypothetical protein
VPGLKKQGPDAGVFVKLAQAPGLAVVHVSVLLLAPGQVTLAKVRGICVYTIKSNTRILIFFIITVKKSISCGSIDT